MNGHYAPNATNNALAMAAISIQIYVNFSSGGMGRRWFCCVVGRKWPMVRIDSMVRGMAGRCFLCFMGWDWGGGVADVAGVIGVTWN